jgi:hypothetical protein
MGVSSLNIVLESGHRIVATEARLGRIITTAPSLSLSPRLAGWMAARRARSPSLLMAGRAGPGPVHRFAHPFPLVDEHFSQSSEYFLIHPSQDSVIPSIRSKILSLHPSKHPLIYPSEDSLIPSVQRFFHPSGFHNLVIHCTLCCRMDDNHGVHLGIFD